jgi:hypothetical protein
MIRFNDLVTDKETVHFLR